MLTCGAKDYQIALDQKIEGHLDGFQNWIGGAYQKFEQAANESGQGFVWEIATALRVMAFYYFDPISFTAEADRVIDRLSDDWNQLKCTLRSLQGRNFVSATVGASLGLADISPHSDVLRLEI